MGFVEFTFAVCLGVLLSRSSLALIGSYRLGKTEPPGKFWIRFWNLMR